MSLLQRRLHTERLKYRQPPVRAVQVKRQLEPARIVWRFSDGKPGHDNQSLGLVDALQQRTRRETYDIPVRPGAGLDWMFGRFPAGSLLPDPWLIIGAGHSTHLPLLAARRARGAGSGIRRPPRRWI